MPRLRLCILDGGCLRAGIVCYRTPRTEPSTKCRRQRPLSSAHMGSHSSFTPLALRCSLVDLTSRQQCQQSVMLGCQQRVLSSGSHEFRFRC